MRLRARHLAGLFLLLAALGTAEAAVPRPGVSPIPTHCIHLLLAQRATQLRDVAPVDPGAREPLALELAPASRTSLAAVLPVASPAAQAAHAHAVSGRSL